MQTRRKKQQANSQFITKLLKQAKESEKNDCAVGGKMFKIEYNVHEYQGVHETESPSNQINTTDFEKDYSAYEQSS